MSNERLAHLQSVLQDIKDFAAGKPVDMVVHYIPTPDVRAIRERMGMTQLDFSRVFGISVGTLRNWEQGRRNPHGPACVLLKVMDKEPEAVKRALAAAREDFKRHRVERLSRCPEAAAPEPAEQRRKSPAASKDQQPKVSP